jgi:hypothetical protein
LDLEEVEKEPRHREGTRNVEDHTRNVEVRTIVADALIELQENDLLDGNPRKVAKSADIVILDRKARRPAPVASVISLT